MMRTSSFPYLAILFVLVCIPVTTFVVARMLGHHRFVGVPLVDLPLQVLATIGFCIHGWKLHRSGKLHAPEAARLVAIALLSSAAICLLTDRLGSNP